MEGSAIETGERGTSKEEAKDSMCNDTERKCFILETTLARYLAESCVNATTTGDRGSRPISLE